MGKPLIERAVVRERRDNTICEREFLPRLQCREDTLLQGGASYNEAPKDVILPVAPASLYSVEHARVVHMAIMCYDDASSTAQQRRQCGQRYRSEPIRHSAPG